MLERNLSFIKKNINQGNYEEIINQFKLNRLQ